MKHIMVFFVFVAWCISSRAEDSQMEVACGEFLSGRTQTGVQGWDFTQSNGVRGDPVGIPFTLNQIRAATNTTGFLAWWAESSRPHAEQFQNGIEVPIVIVTSHTNGFGVGMIAADDGTLITYIDHQSPRPSPAVIEARQAAALAARTKAVAGVRVWRAASTNHVAAASSVPALRIAVQELQLQVDYLLRLNNVTP